MKSMERVERMVETLLRARSKALPIENLITSETPMSMEEAYLVQDKMVSAIGEIGGWKMGAPSPADEISFGPMPAAWAVPSGSTLSDPRYRLRGVELEIAFRLGGDLPSRERVYSREEVADTIAECVPAFELIESGFKDPRSLTPFTVAADLLLNGGFVFGPPIEDWRSIDWSTETGRLFVDGKLEVERTASNPAGTDLLRLLVFLADRGGRTKGLRKGDWVTTGSWTGTTWVKAGQRVVGSFAHSGIVAVRFAA